MGLGRTALHIAVLKEREEIVHYLAARFKQVLQIGDNVSNESLKFALLCSNLNSLFIFFSFSLTLSLSHQLERTPLHYAMGVSSVETISRILIKNGAKRVLKDLKGRQPSYYFMNRSDIFRLQEEEEEDELNA